MVVVGRQITAVQGEVLHFVWMLCYNIGKSLTKDKNGAKILQCVVVCELNRVYIVNTGSINLLTLLNF